MCKLLELRGHPSKFIECKSKCNSCTKQEYIQAAVTLWLVVLGVGIVGLICFS